MNSEAKAIMAIGYFIESQISKVELILLQAEKESTAGVLKLNIEEYTEAMASILIIKDMCYHMS